MIAGTWARFRAELEDHLKEQVGSKLNSGRWLEDDTVLRVELPDSLAQYVKDAVEQRKVPPVEKVREVSQTYEISLQTVKALCEKLEIPTEEIQEILP